MLPSVFQENAYYANQTFDALPNYQKGNQLGWLDAGVRLRYTAPLHPA
jgi:hypothetical protein